MKVNIHSGSQPLQIPPMQKKINRVHENYNIFKTTINTLVNEKSFLKNIMDAYINIKRNV